MTARARTAAAVPRWPGASVRSRGAAAGRRHAGLLLCLLAACGFGAMAVLAKLAYDAGASVPTVLAVRFGIAATVLWVLVARPWAPGVRTRIPRRRAMAAGIALGAVLYAAESGLFFVSLTRLDASLAELALFTYPALVLVGALVVGREQPSRRRAGALLLALGGVALVLASGAGSDVDGVGALLALGAATFYATYVLIADTLSGELRPLALAALVCTGACASFTVAGAALGSLSFGFAAHAWWLIGAIALVSTVVPLASFLAGVRRLGPSNAAIVSAVEPVVTLGLAFALLGDRLSPPQLAGGALVLGAVLVLQVRSGPGRPRPEAATA